MYAQNEPAKRNYAYDQQGNLISDKAEEIANIEWTATGKVRRITRTAQSIKPDLEFRYDALGNRVSKTVISKTDGKCTSTYYVRDAKGTTLATYTEAEGKLHLSEQHLYGAKRLGMRSSNLLVASTNGGNSTQEESNGEKRYELTNHLGNVLAVVSGEKKDGSAQILSITDYYPFGMEMDGRKYSKLTTDGGYRYGFQSQEKETDIWNGEASFFKYRISDNRLGRFFSVDPLAQEYPWNSCYAFSENRVIDGVELEGLEFMFSNPGLMLSNSGSNWLPRITRISKSPFSKPGRGAGWKQWLRFGRQNHKYFEEQWKSEGYKVEQGIGKGNRVDGIKIDETNRIGYIRELKPNNPAGIRAGRLQLERYLKAAEKHYPGVEQWQPILELYEAKSILSLFDSPTERALEAFDYNPSSFTMKFYTFQEGETMEDVASSFSMDVDFLYEINGIKRDDKIEPGREILIDIQIEKTRSYDLEEVNYDEPI